MCPRQAQIAGVTDVSETWWEKWLSYAYSPFFSWGQPGATAVVKTEAAMGLLTRWHRGYNALWFCLSCIFSFCGREVIHYKAKYIHDEKKNTKSTETALFSPKSRSRQQKITTWFLFGSSADNYVPFWRGTGFCQTQATGHQAEVLW